MQVFLCLETIRLLVFLAKGSELPVPWRKSYSELAVSREKLTQWKKRIESGAVHVTTDGLVAILDALHCTPNALFLTHETVAKLIKSHPILANPDDRQLRILDSIVAGDDLDPWFSSHANLKMVEVSREFFQRLTCDYSGPFLEAVRLWAAKKLAKCTPGETVLLTQFDHDWLCYSADGLLRHFDHIAMHDGEVPAITAFAIQPAGKPSASVPRSAGGHWYAETIDLLVPGPFHFNCPPKKWYASLEIRQRADGTVEGTGVDKDGDPVHIQGTAYEAGNVYRIYYDVRNTLLHAHGTAMLEYSSDGRSMHGLSIARETGHGVPFVPGQVSLQRTSRQEHLDFCQSHKKVSDVDLPQNTPEK